LFQDVDSNIDLDSLPTFDDLIESPSSSRHPPSIESWRAILLNLVSALGLISPSL
ncbi:unnamed protein product, partial [Musa textilis]